VAAWQQGGGAAEIAAAATAVAAASCRQRGIGGSTNNQQSTKSSDCSGNGNGDDDSDDNDNGYEGNSGNLLLPTPPPPPTPRYRQAAAAAAKLAAAYAAAALPLPQAMTKRAADGAINNHHCLSISFVGIDGGCEHYLPFHQPHSDDFMPDANHQQIWLIALHVAQPPPILLVPLHPNTMGNAANAWFCQNLWWGQVIGGVCE